MWICARETASKQLAAICIRILQVEPPNIAPQQQWILKQKHGCFHTRKKNKEDLIVMKHDGHQRRSPRECRNNAKLVSIQPQVIQHRVSARKAKTPTQRKTRKKKAIGGRGWLPGNEHTCWVTADPQYRRFTDPLMSGNVCRVFSYRISALSEYKP